MDDQLRYRLITGKDDASFCQRISKLLDEDSAACMNTPGTVGDNWSWRLERELSPEAAKRLREWSRFGDRD
ncbi:DUF1737 domain-containing protein [Sporomusa acidovorans]|uniref:DUF1737 domain-containing protein n=1 Tax=Sporomusa acidovorans (strain ATCC 49682 / DSM 3132 / Mol) TaxID=1123286 RepID=A0ABZ3J2J2_SPOA4|nr:DUF1737 domain-containing protein [Sporomusa acidovorans]OZC13649.1 hypothetical protein SPACI_56300 [Sporomusa acidovorans DSM 3132]SDE86089.1 protein of unknown function [Sporomusa acidovorans]